MTRSATIDTMNGVGDRPADICSLVKPIAASQRRDMLM
jgi:hypothetical protein